MGGVAGRWLVPLVSLGLLFLLGVLAGVVGMLVSLGAEQVQTPDALTLWLAVGVGIVGRAP